MPSVKQLKQEEASLSAIGNFFSAYQKLTIYQMQQNRDKTINSRKFFQGLLDTFVDLKQDLRRLIKTDEKKNIVSFSTLTKNGKTVDVFLSFETKFSTSTNRQALEFFREVVSTRESDLVIIGATARRLYKEYFPEESNFTYFDLKETETSLKQNADIMRHLLTYETINVFNPYYVTLMEQKPQVETITGDFSLEETNEEEEKKHFLFEPDKKKILHFFEIQIMSNLFQHKIKEAHLANLGSRIATLQNTQSNLETEMERVKRLKRKTMKYKANKKQRNRLSGMRFWMS